MYDSRIWTVDADSEFSKVHRRAVQRLEKAVRLMQGAWNSNELSTGKVGKTEKGGKLIPLPK